MTATQTESITNKNEVKEKVKTWFDELVEQIRVDQIMMETDTASPAKERAYNSLIFGQEIELASMSRITSTMYFIKNLLFDYISELKKHKTQPFKLALDLSDAKILVWAEIENGDEDAEDALILSEAKANSKYSEYGFHVTSTIVEKNDCVEKPPHYQVLSFDK